MTLPFQSFIVAFTSPLSAVAAIGSAGSFAPYVFDWFTTDAVSDFCVIDSVCPAVSEMPYPADEPNVPCVIE